MTNFEKNVRKIAEIIGMEDQLDDVAYALLKLIYERRLNWRKI